jgi:8-oxo-dGTP diphosphatase
MTSRSPSEDRYSGPTVTTDAVVLRLAESALEVLVHRRPRPPFAGMTALPGLYVGQDETIAMATTRCLRDKVGLTLPASAFTKIVNVYDNLSRDPRGHSLSVVTVALLPSRCQLDVDERAQWVETDIVESLAFDHVEIVGSTVQWVRQHLWTDAALLAALIGSQPLTTSTLLTIARIVEGVSIDASNLRRRLSSTGLLEPTTNRIAHDGPGRPSVQWRWT